MPRLKIDFELVLFSVQLMVSRGCTSGRLQGKLATNCRFQNIKIFRLRMNLSTINMHWMGVGTRIKHTIKPIAVMYTIC